MASHLISLSVLLAGAVGLAQAAEEPAAAPADAASAPVPAPVAAPAACALRLPAGERVGWRGAYNLDKAGGGPGTFLYPAPNVGGFLGSVLVHALMQNSRDSSEKDRARNEADQVLLPYLPVLNGFTARDLMQRGAGHALPGYALSLSDGRPAGGWTIDSAPGFVMEQDARALVLENTVAVFGPGDAGEPGYRNTVRVVSAPHTESDISAHWLADQGERLKAESAALLAESFRAALADARRPAAQTAPSRTFRYMMGSAERMERGQLIEAGCERAVIKTLRGWLMSIPLRREDPAAVCADVAKAP